MTFDPPPAKELRLFGLADWTLERFIARRTRLHELQYAATRLREQKRGADAKAFYGGWARLWPQQMSADVAALQAATDVHAPGQWRTNGPLINQTSFATTFACKPPAKMVLAKDQQPIQVWGLAPAVETPEDPKAKSKK